MLKSRLLNTNTFVRYASQEGKKRFMRTVPVPSKRSPAADFGRLNRQIPADLPRPDITSRTWAKHSLGSPLAQTQSQQPKKETPRWSKHSIEASGDAPQQEEITLLAPVRRSRTSRFRGARSGNQETSSSTTAVSADSGSSEPLDSTSKTLHTQAAGIAAELPKITIEPAVTPGVEKMLNSAEKSAETPVKAKKPRRQLKPRKALITLSSSALENLRGLLDQPEPQLIRIGVQNRGCSGLTYHLEYVSKPGKFDEIVEQDGVTVVIDSKALFSIVGSEMDWIDDKLSSRFIFKNPNSKGTCGCGESFMV